MRLYWKRAAVTAEVAAALDSLGAEYPLREGEGRPMLRFQPGAPAGSLEMTREAGAVHISYGTLADALRAVGAALANLLAPSGRLGESRHCTTLGIMLDCSRNAVMEVHHVKAWLRRLALLGYNMMMLYTEDTYQLSDEPFFGFFRGAYSPQELKEIDEYAAGLGIEMIGCIQTLGHLSRILQWPAYQTVKDTNDILLVGEPRSYELIRKMVGRYAECFRSRRIHIGMDEAHSLGRGAYLDRHGLRRRFDIFSEHLSRVQQLCREHGLRPMIWSDMYFRMGSRTNDYYDREAVIPADVRAAIPADVDFVFWDYYHARQDDYSYFIQAHRDLGKEPVMGSGVWSWAALWYLRHKTEDTVGLCVEACKRAGTKEIFFTLWGDDGACCEFDSVFAGLAFAAARVFGEPEESLRKRYRAVCGMEYDAVALPFDLDVDTVGLLWDDPLFGLHWLRRRAEDPDHWDTVLRNLQGVVAGVSPRCRKAEPVDMAHLATLVRFLAAKIEFRERLEEAYFSRDQDKLAAVAGEASKMMRATAGLVRTFRRQWLRRNRPVGLEVIQLRLGGLRERCAETAALLQELLSGEREAIWELDEGRSLDAASLQQSRRDWRYLSTASPSVL